MYLFFPKQGKSPRKHEVIFITPTGEEINHKRRLDQYLKAHPGGPAAAEFDWSTGETPRRSARISEKSKVTPPVEREHPKRRRSSVSKKDIKETEAEPEVLEEEKEIDNQDGEKHESMVDAEVKDEKVTKDEAVEAEAAPKTNDAEKQEHKIGSESEQEKLDKDLNEKEPESSKLNLNENLEGAKPEEAIEEPQVQKKPDGNLGEATEPVSLISDENENVPEENQKPTQQDIELDKGAATPEKSEKHTEADKIVDVAVSATAGMKVVR
ncbi:methyl-CpG-binding domain-containing protein 10-like isoform X2 [Cucurbita maxima]|uniref:Methyl-CpG-binding domain-containing protein 10-like isoform X2 n=1 Tax=Cucurbita maxima TaxID=3661 RepID=A0A6J1HMU6_CUCMA|nr:methyl-CpG-binding domain-containing protein 10-like isoform X2 [Cucurbita maxima]XP_022965864.1 methyl-CpG-binding domain-containing protein 10-like isoform X2 [Cucurbita maxima]XP_022965865.1 methyl-CpG-binding domain-containing protein 10-like isoform X2 [Cucurbita maxima]XP_022965866.1 methyl-CpG-binding domain-containing protein 10-like isoform X2 [Cucurbita maxima]